MINKIFDRIIIDPIRRANLRHEEAVAKITLNVEEQLIEYCKRVNKLQQNKKES